MLPADLRTDRSIPVSLIPAKCLKSKVLPGLLEKKDSLPPVYNVTCRFPAHELVSGASKIPTILYYDQSGKVRAVGAEAAREGILETAEDEHWVKAEW